MSLTLGKLSLIRKHAIKLIQKSRESIPLAKRNMNLELAISGRKDNHQVNLKVGLES